MSSSTATTKRGVSALSEDTQCCSLGRMTRRPSFDWGWGGTASLNADARPGTSTDVANDNDCSVHSALRRFGDPSFESANDVGEAAGDAAPAAEMLREVLTVEEAAQLLRVNRKTLYTAISAGEIPGVRRIGGVIRLSRDRLLRWLSEGDGRTSRRRGRP
jgi:excisionase family DNA binding protein